MHPFRLNNFDIFIIMHINICVLYTTFFLYLTFSLSSTLFHVVLYWLSQATVECVGFCVQVWGLGGGGGQGDHWRCDWAGEGYSVGI